MLLKLCAEFMCLRKSMLQRQDLGAYASTEEGAYASTEEGAYAPTEEGAYASTEEGAYASATEAGAPRAIVTIESRQLGLRSDVAAHLKSTLQGRSSCRLHVFTVRYLVNM